MTNLLPRAAARIHAMTGQWSSPDWAALAAIAHAARQHALNEAELAAIEADRVPCGWPERKRRIDIAQSAVRASQGILEQLLEGVEG